MRLVVVKAKLKNKIDFLKSLADIDLEFGDIYYQHDRIFLPRGYEPSKDLPKMTIQTNILNVGKKPVYKMIFKRHVEDQGIDIVHSTEITDYTESAYMMHQLGFELNIEVAKQRQELTMAGGAKMYIDKIDGLGNFVRIEMMAEDNDSVSAIKEDLEKVLQVLGIKESQIVEESYGELTKKKRN